MWPLWEELEEAVPFWAQESIPLIMPDIQDSTLTLKLLGGEGPKEGPKEGTKEEPKEGGRCRETG